MGTNLFTSALSGMNAAQIGLATTQHNIANANTAGFTRQEVVIGSRTPQSLGGSFLGQGVDVVGVKRLYDEFLTTQIRQEQAQESYLSSYLSMMRQVDNLIADPTAGASPAMQEFFNALNGVANSPESIPARQTMLGNAQFVVNRFQAIDQRLTDIANGLNKQITASVGNINTFAQQIAALNGNIKQATANSLGAQLPNDLLDQRDQIINQLNKEIKVTVQEQPDGTASVFIGSGQPLVINERAMKLNSVQSATDPSKLDIAYQNGNVQVTMQQSSLQGGNLGAYLAFRDQSLEPARNALGRVAIGLAESINQQNRMGLDLNGNLGGDLFNVASPRVEMSANNDPASGVPSVTIADVAGLTASDYRLTYNGAASGYTLLRLSDNTATNYAVLPQTVDGMTINAPIPVSAGDSFLIRPTANAARDIRLLTNDPIKVAAAVPMRASADLSNTGSASISGGTVNTPLPLHANLRDPVSIVFDTPTTFTVTGATPPVVGSVAYTSGADISYNGWTVKITGTPAAGDTFDIVNNTNATGDNRNALLMAGMQTQNLLANGTTSFQGAYGQLVGEVGSKTHELDVTSQAQSSMLSQTVAAQQSISGVNLDEEAANLLRYQQAYQAAAKAIQIANTMFDTLLSLGD